MIAVYAHRGVTGLGGGRENTLDAFVAARRAGADGIELDVRLTADAQLVVHHEPVVPGAGPVANISSSELPGFVPLLEDALVACGDLAVNVEVKHEPSADPGRQVAAAVGARLAAVCDGRGAGGGDAGRPALLVSSFDAETLRVLRAAVPAVPAGLVVDWRTPVEAAIDQAASLGCASVHLFVTQAGPRAVAQAHQAALGVHVWTVNAEADLAAVAAAGVDAIITDRVAAARRVLGRNGGRSAG